MRPNGDNSYVNRATSGVETVRMSFDENSIGFLMDVMTNLYSDTTGAPIREYPSNALDSHREAGVTRPVEVRLPTRFNPRFEVQDFGLGMSPDDITKIYSKYGYSTKRDDDVAVGMLGLGSKSGLTYADQFSVIAVKNGVKTMATVARGTDGAGTINILDTRGTDEGNGVTIGIPVHNVDEFRRKAMAFFRWWEPGTILIDGEPPVYPETDTLRVDDDIVVHKNHSVDEDLVVMGCIAYPVGSRLSAGLPWGYNVVAYVPMGTVNFPPNREALQYTARTEKAIAAINDRRAAGIKAAAEADIAGAKTFTDAIRAARTWNKLLGGTFPEYKGHTIPSKISGEVSNGNKQRFWFYNGNNYRHRTTELTSIEAERFVDTVVVKNFSNVSFSTHNRKKIKHYFEQNGIATDTYIVTDAMIGGVWADGITTVDWNDVKLIRFSTGGRSATKGPVEHFDTYVNGQFQQVTEVTGDDIVMVSPADLSERQRSPLVIKTVAEALPGATLVVLAKNRWDKFKRENDNVRTLAEAIAARFTEFCDSLTDFEYTELSGSSYSYSHFRGLDSNRIDDPEVKELIKQMSVATNRSVRGMYQTIRRVYSAAVDSWNVPGVPDRDVQFEEVLDRYPFVQYAGRTDNDHTHLYINLVYRDGKGTK